MLLTRLVLQLPDSVGCCDGKRTCANRFLLVQHIDPFTQDTASACINCQRPAPFQPLSVSPIPCMSEGSQITASLTLTHFPFVPLILAHFQDIPSKSTHFQDIPSKSTHFQDIPSTQIAGSSLISCIASIARFASAPVASLTS